jgi:hypothetical protein
MNIVEAKEILDSIVSQYRKKTYHELIKLVDGDIGVFHITGASGTEYEIEIDVFMDEANEKNVRFDAILDIGTISSLFPMRESFVKNPNDEFSEDEYEEPLF